MITLELLQHMCPHTHQATLEMFVDPLNDVAKHYDMLENPKREAAFVAQVAHESGGFTATKENLKYKAASLMKTFHKYFPSMSLAMEYERQPEKIANRVYANRMGNGDEASGDGWMFHGRGLIQLTGRDNYTRFAKSIGKTVEDTAAYMETAAGATASAGWFWYVNKLNAYCDSDNFVMLTRRINGGTIGIEDRKRLYLLALGSITHG